MEMRCSVEWLNNTHNSMVHTDFTAHMCPSSPHLWSVDVEHQMKSGK